MNALKVICLRRFYSLTEAQALAALVWGADT